MARYLVSRGTPHPSYSYEFPTLRLAKATAAIMGEPIAIWKFDARARHWTLILDRSIPQAYTDSIGTALARLTE